MKPKWQSFFLTIGLIVLMPSFCLLPRLSVDLTMLFSRYSLNGLR